MVPQTHTHNTGCKTIVTIIRNNCKNMITFTIIIIIIIITIIKNLQSPGWGQQPNSSGHRKSVFSPSNPATQTDDDADLEANDDDNDDDDNGDDDDDSDYGDYEAGA